MLSATTTAQRSIQLGRVLEGATQIRCLLETCSDMVKTCVLRASRSHVSESQLQNLALPFHRGQSIWSKLRGLGRSPLHSQASHGRAGMDSLKREASTWWVNRQASACRFVSEVNVVHVLHRLSRMKDPGKRHWQSQAHQVVQRSYQAKVEARMA